MSHTELSDDLRAAARRIRETPACENPGPDCACVQADQLAGAFEAEALRGEQLGLIDAELLRRARAINAAAVPYDAVLAREARAAG